VVKTQFAQKTVNFAKAAGQRARGLVTALNSRIGGFVNGAMQRARNVANQGRGLLGKVMGPFMGMATKAFDAVQSRVSQAVNMVKTEVERGKDVALKVGSKIADTTRKAGNLLKDFTQSAIQKGRQALQTAKQWSSQQIKTATELGSRWVTQARKRVADLVSNGVKLAKEKAIPFIKQKVGGVKHRIKNFLQDKWSRLKEKLGIKKPGKEGPKGGAKDTPDTAAKKAAELPAAIAQAKTITEANDAANTPVPALIGVLNASVKSQYSWIKRFEARPKPVPGHYSVHMIASDHEIDPDYTTGPGEKGAEVTIRGTPDKPHELAQANRFGQVEGGGEFEFLGNSSQGVEGYFTPTGSTTRIPVSFKDFSDTGRMPNLIGKINKNANRILPADAGKTVLHAAVPQFKADEMIDFIQNGPIINMPNEAKFERLIFDCKDGVVVVDASGVRLR
jgi:F0F1-type ATP synthase membrane subunit b/b'